jgi:16S rRNA (guanine1207-N2)-methyltransferase
MLRARLFACDEARAPGARIDAARGRDLRIACFHRTARMATPSDPALATLLLPLADGTLAWPGRGLFLQARAGWPLQALSLPGLSCTQYDRTAYEGLQAAGHDVTTSEELDPDARWPLVMVLAPRQREAARALFAEALARLEPGGRILACMPNREGARSGESDLARIAGPLASLSKHHCRAFWTGMIDAPSDRTLALQWRALAQPRWIESAQVPGGGFHSRPGIFAWDRVDPASALLAEHLPVDLAGRGADLGAGWGYLALRLLERCPGVEALDLFEADARALACARLNLVPHAGRARAGFHWHDVAAGIAGRHDFVVSNPPFHASGRDARPELGRAFIAAAASALRPGGRLWLVANRHLPYEQALGDGFAQVRSVAQRDGFKVLEAIRG